MTFLLTGPLVIIDCLRQNKSIKSTTVDVRIEFDCKENVPANTIVSSYTIAIEYYPLSNIAQDVNYK